MERKFFLLLIVFWGFTFQLFAQTKQVTGTVTDENGTPLGSVSVQVKGTTQGVATDFDGKYSINVPQGGVLLFSSVGFASQEKKVTSTGKSVVINVVLKEDTQELSEVIVVGYGTKKKENLSGAVASVDTRKLNTRPSSNITKALQGAVAGVTIISRPGGTSLNIRGRGNLGSSDPLYIVDGIEVSSGFFNAIDPNNIENISFLKDASSAAIYGAKAAYGVVLVTTKTAKAGVMQISYNGSTGVQMPTYLPKVVNSAEYAEMYRTAERNGGVREDNLTFTNEMVQKYRDGSDPDRYPNTNWFDLILRKQSFITKHNLQLSGGVDKFKYLVDTGFLQEEGNTIGSKTNRYNFNTKTSSDIKKWLTLTTNMNVIYTKYNNDRGGANLVEALRIPPTQVAKHSNGEWGSVRNGRQNTGAEINRNPLRLLTEDGRSNYTQRRILGTVAAEVRPLEGMKITNQFAYSYYDYRNFSFTNRKKALQS